MVTTIWRFREYSSLAKDYRTQTTLGEFFRKLVSFLLEIACIHPTTYAMPKKKANFIIVRIKETRSIGVS